MTVWKPQLQIQQTKKVRLCEFVYRRDRHVSRQATCSVAFVDEPLSGKKSKSDSKKKIKNIKDSEKKIKMDNHFLKDQLCKLLAFFSLKHR